MFNKKKLFPVCCLLLILAIPIAAASDLTGELKIAASVKKHLISGQAITLNADHQFLAITDNQTPTAPKGSILILHGAQSNPNAPQLIRPLRTRLPTLGWITLSIQLPILSPDPSMDTYQPWIKKTLPRIEVALNHLKMNNPDKPVIVIAHSLGAVSALSYLSQLTAKSVCDAFVLISMPPTETKQTDSVSALSKIDIPVLDIYASQDWDNVKRSASSRKLTLKKKNKLNRQIEITGANHFYNGLDDELALSIYGWLTYITKKP